MVPLVGLLEPVLKALGEALGSGKCCPGCTRLLFPWPVAVSPTLATQWNIPQS